MKYEDLSFTTKNEAGEELINDIIGVIPNKNNSEEPYVIFTNYELDATGEFINQYGRLVKENDSFGLETNLKKSEIDYIEESMKDEIVKYVNDTIEENLHE